MAAGGRKVFEFPVTIPDNGNSTVRVVRRRLSPPPDQDLRTRRAGVEGAQGPAPCGAFCHGLLPVPLAEDNIVAAPASVTASQKQPVSQSAVSLTGATTTGDVDKIWFASATFAGLGTYERRNSISINSPQCFIKCELIGFKTRAQRR